MTVGAPALRRIAAWRVMHRLLSLIVLGSLLAGVSGCGPSGARGSVPAPSGNAGASAVVPVPVAPASSSAADHGAGRLTGGLIAYRDPRGIGVVDPLTGRHKLLLSVPNDTMADVAAGAVGVPYTLAGPVWGPSGRARPDLYFWVTDWSRVGRPVLMRADPFSGSLRAVAVAASAPCEPGFDLVALPAAVAFTVGGCDLPRADVLAVPAPHAPPQTLPPPPNCPPQEAVVGGIQVLGAAPDGRVLLDCYYSLGPGDGGHTVLFWSDPQSGSAEQLSPAPPPSVDAAGPVAAAVSPHGHRVAFANGLHGVGVFNLATGAWQPVRLPLPAAPPCARNEQGAVAVAWSPAGRRLAVAANGDLFLTNTAGRGTPRTLRTGTCIWSLSWAPVSGGVALHTIHPLPLPDLPSVLARVSATVASLKARDEASVRSWVLLPQNRGEGIACPDPECAFPPLIREVMGRVAAETSVPLWAPVVLRTSPGSERPTGASFRVTPHAYAVDVGRCVNLPPPSESVGTLSDDCDMAALTSGFDFGGRTYPDAAAARTAVERLLGDAPGMGSPPLATTRFVPVDLGHRVTGSEAPVGGGVVRWEMQGWRFEENLAACISLSPSAPPPLRAVPMARADVAWLAVHPLPAVDGAFLAGGSCGDVSSGSASARWAVGRTVYSVEVAGYADMTALDLVRSMRPFPRPDVP